MRGTRGYIGKHARGAAARLAKRTGGRGVLLLGPVERRRGSRAAAELQSAAAGGWVGTLCGQTHSGFIVTNFRSTREIEIPFFFAPPQRRVSPLQRRRRNADHGAAGDDAVRVARGPPRRARETVRRTVRRAASLALVTPHLHRSSCAARSARALPAAASVRRAARSESVSPRRAAPSAVPLCARRSTAAPPGARLTRRRRLFSLFVLSQAVVKPLVGNVAPDFTAEAVFDQEFMTVTLSKYRGKRVRRVVSLHLSFNQRSTSRRYVVLFFYPLDFTFVCPVRVAASFVVAPSPHTSPPRQTEITAFSDRYAEFKAANTEVLGVSVDSQFSHLAWHVFPFFFPFATNVTAFLFQAADGPQGWRPGRFGVPAGGGFEKGDRLVLPRAQRRRRRAARPVHHRQGGGGAGAPHATTKTHKFFFFFSYKFFAYSLFSTQPSTTSRSAAAWTRRCARCRRCSTCRTTPTRCAPRGGRRGTRP